MADPSRPAPMPSTSLMPARVDTDLGVRPRNRRGHSGLHQTSTPNLTPGQSPSASRGGSPLPSRGVGGGGKNIKNSSSSGRASPANGFSRGLLEGAWTPNWASVQDFATSLMAGSDTGYNSEASRPSSRGSGKAKPKSIWKGIGRVGSGANATAGSWGPAPPSSSNLRPRPEDIAAGSLREREAQVMARKRASVLQSHEGVNGGLDVSGKYKRRNSDEALPSSTLEPAEEEHLVYLHHVQPTDTYAGIILRYRCQEHAFRRTNGIWSQNNIQIRKHLLIPVDACEVKGRPCEAPSYYSQEVDLLAATPQPSARSGTPPGSQTDVHDDFFTSRPKATEEVQQEEQEKLIDPWTHVKWVKLDSVPTPVEIVRVSRRATGYFPPRRKRSVNTVSTFSTPRQSLDLSRAGTNASEVAVGSPCPSSHRRQSSMGSRALVGSLSSSSSTRGRGSSLSDSDKMPAWMRKPGGVGSMSRSVHAPGPAGDSLNKWVNKRLPGFNIDTLPSMSVMGSESARFGFVKTPGDSSSTGIVESPWDEGHEATSSARNGMGLEQAAASIETWLRGAWAKRPGTPRAASFGGRRSGQQQQEEDSDLIEMTDTGSDDGRVGGGFGGGSRGLLDQDHYLQHQHQQGTTAGSSSDFDGGTSVRGRAGGATKGKKAD